MRLTKLWSGWIPAVILLVLFLCASVQCESDGDDDGGAMVSLINLFKNVTGSIGSFSDGSSQDPNSVERNTTAEVVTATPALETSTMLTTTSLNSGEGTTGASSFFLSSSAEQAATISPSSPSLPTMIITATKVTLGHRMGNAFPNDDNNNGDENTTGSDDKTEGLTEMPEGFTTVLPQVREQATSEASIQAAPNTRKGRFQRLPENEESATESVATGVQHHESATDYYRELEGEGGDSYDGDFGEDNELGGEQLPAPMALINMNGEGNNPPLEDDFAEAFKKVSSTAGRRRRFRGGRRGRMKLKKLNGTVISADLQPAGSRPDVAHGSRESSPSGPSPTRRPRIYRSTTTSPAAFSSQSPSPSPTSTENSFSLTSPVVKNGPKPIILQNINSGSDNLDEEAALSVTPSPQLERPGTGAHTEKISTYFFSTPSPSTRMRMRQKVRESTGSTSTTTEMPPSTASSSSFTGSDSWKKGFEDFPKSSFFQNPALNMKIPAFVPIDIGLEKDDTRTDPVVENSLTKPDDSQLENKAYTIRHPPDGVSHTNYESYSTSSTTPKSKKVRGPATSYTRYDYGASPATSTTSRTQEGKGSEYYGQGSQSESSTTFASVHRPGAAGSGSHYDRTKDQVIYYKDTPYVHHHLNSDLPVAEPTIGSSHTVGTHLSVVDHTSNLYGSPLTSTLDQYAQSLYTPGQVYSEVAPHLDAPFKNGPPDASHIHSPNMIDGSAALGHPEPTHVTYLGSTQVSKPEEDVYHSSVDEVPAHGGAGLSHYDHTTGHVSYPYPTEYSKPSPPSYHSSHDDHHSLQHHHHHHSLHHHGATLSFTPSFEIKPEDNPMSPLFAHGKPTGSSGPDHLGNVLPLPDPPQAESLKSDEISEIVVSSPSGPAEEMPSGPPPSPPPTEGSHYDATQADHTMNSHYHTMAAHADYEPANPPLPHGHPFHKGFISFPTPEIGASSPPADHSHHGGQYQDTNSIGSTPYHSHHHHPASVEHHSSSGQGFEAGGDLIQPVKDFAPIPDDVGKHTDVIYSSYPSPPPHIHPPSGETTYSLGPTGQSHQTEVDHQVTSYGGDSSYASSPTGSDGVGYQTGGVKGHHGYAGPVSEIHGGSYGGGASPETVVVDHYHGNGGEGDHHLPGGGSKENPQDNHVPLDEDRHPSSSAADLATNLRNKQKATKQSFSKTPYVLMFPQLIPEEAMRPSPPAILTKEIPVIQASSMGDYAAASGLAGEGGEKHPFGPGFQAVPVHPRHQMYQVLAKTHYDKMMEKYLESKRKPPSAIYTPYGVLIPVGTNVAEAASTMSQHSPFGKPGRLPPKFPRAEKSLLNALLGSSSSNTRFFPPPNTGFGGVMDTTKGGKLPKMMEYEPAIDVLAEKLALKIVAAQQALRAKGSQGSYSELKPVLVEKSMRAELDQSDPNSKAIWNRDQDQITMESQTSPELKEYLKGVLKGHITEMVKTSAPFEDGRRPMATLSSKLINSFFRKGRLNIPPKSMIPLASASMLMPNKVPPPPPPMQSSPLHHGASLGHLPSLNAAGIPQLVPPHGPVGLLGTIKRLFSFGPPERHDGGLLGMGPTFAGRTLYIQNGTYLPYVDGPSPRSSHIPPIVGAAQQVPPQNIVSPPPSHHGGGMLNQYHSVPHSMAPSKRTTPVVTTYDSVLGPSSTKAPKKKRKSTKKPFSVEEPTSSKWQNIRLTSPSALLSTFTSAFITTQRPSPRGANATNILLRGKHKSSEKMRGDPSTDSKIEMILNRRQPGSTTTKPSSPAPSSSKLDMFQTLLGSTRSVLNYFKTEGRKAAAAAATSVAAAAAASATPTVLKPRSSSNPFTFNSPFRKRREVSNRRRRNRRT